MKRKEEITPEIFERVNIHKVPMIDFSCPALFMKEIAENPEKSFFIYETDGGNIVVARRVETSGGGRIDFIINPE